MNLIHIGLGKTATTSLQNSVFPHIKYIRSNVRFNPPNVMIILNKLIFCELSDYEKKLVKQRLSDGENLISFESLVDWNPRNWEMAADLNLELFGPDNHIIITVRDTHSYLTSVYQQMIHEGNIKKAQDFFVTSQEYDLLSMHISRKGLHYFDVDSFDLQRLKQLYEKRFKKVTIVPMNSLSNFYFLKDHYLLSDKEVEKFKELFFNAPKSNVAYSHLAMTLTFWRESILKSLGLKTMGSLDLSLINSLRDCEKNKIINEASNSSFRDLSLVQKLLQSPKIILKKVSSIHIFRWRKLMQFVVNKLFPYKKYKLPIECYRNKNLEEKNDAFIKDSSVSK